MKKDIKEETTPEKKREADPVETVQRLDTGQQKN